MDSNNNKLTTKLSTKVIMSVADVVCKLWWYGRCKLRRQVNDFDYHITDLRKQYPNELVYKHSLGKLPFILKTVELDDETEKTTSLKIGDCNIRYTFDKLMKRGEAYNDERIFMYHQEPRTQMMSDLLTNTVIRHNEPKSLKVINFKREKTNVVKLHNK